MPNSKQRSALFAIAKRRDVQDSRRVEALERKGFVRRDPRGNPTLTDKGREFVRERAPALIHK
jgi:Mn-dependent DtxR family transcriptional regulator